MRRLLMILALTAAIFAADAASPKWEEVSSVPTVVQTQLNESEQVQTAVKDGYIYIVSSQPVTVKLFTILGQLISQETIPAGTHRFKMTTRGIYILKAGGLTRRVTI